MTVEYEKQLGQSLVEEGLLTESQLRTTLEYQNSLGGKLEEIILKLGFVSEGELNAVVARCEGMRSIDLSGRSVDYDLMAQIPRKVIEKHEAVPLRNDDDSVLLAMSESSDFQAIEDIQFLTNRKIETALAPRSQILEAIATFFRERGEPEGPEKSIEEKLLARIADPAVAALARLLLSKGVIEPEEWERELE